MALKDSILALEPANLRGYYPCDQASGATLLDESGQGNHLTIFGTPTFSVPGPAGDAIRFDITAGTPQYASGNSDWTVMPAAWTVLWINRREQNLIATSYYWGFDDTVEGAAAATCFNGTSGQNDNCRWLIRDDSNVDQYHQTCPVTRFDPTEWQMCAITYDGTSYHFYQDGQLSLLNEHPFTQGTVSADTFSINRRPNDMAPGGTIQTIQHVAYWDTALTWRQIRTLYFEAAVVGGDLPWFDVDLIGQDTAGGVIGDYETQVRADGGILYRMGDGEQTQWIMPADDDVDLAASFESGSTNPMLTFRKEGPAFGGYAIGLAPTAGAIEIPDPTNGGALPLSIELWLKGTHVTADYFFAHRDGGASPEPYISMLWETVSLTDRITLTVRDNTGNTAVLRGDWPDDVNWHHVVAVIEATGLTLHIDTVATSVGDTFTGVFDAAVTAINGITSNGGTSYTNKITADIAEVAFYPGVALSAAQVENHYDIIADGMLPPGPGGGIGLLAGIIGNGVF